MGYLTFGEQVKVVLSRKGMTIKDLAETIEQTTGKKMSRQNLTQRLGRDNFQEQDMRMISAILGCPFTLDILAGAEPAAPGIASGKSKSESAKAFSQNHTSEAIPKEADLQIPEADTTAADTEEITTDTDIEEATVDTGIEEVPADTDIEEMSMEESTEESVGASSQFSPSLEEEEAEHEMTIGELYNIHQELNKMETGEIPAEAIQQELGEDEILQEEFEEDWDDDEADFEPVVSRNDEDEDLSLGEVNPYTGHEYQSNSVRMHPKRIGYVQVYDRSRHSWNDMTEWAFLGYQERKKALLGKAYEPPIYLD